MTQVIILPPKKVYYRWYSTDSKIYFKENAEHVNSNFHPIVPVEFDDINGSYQDNFEPYEIIDLVPKSSPFFHYWPRNIEEIVNMYAMMEIPDVEEESDENVQSMVPKSRNTTALEDRLKTTCERVMEKWDAFVDQEPTGKMGKDLQKNQSRVVYLKEIVPLQIYELTEIMETLMIMDNYYEEKFAKLSEKIKKINAETNPKEKAKLLLSLAMIAESALPDEIKFKHTNTIVPIISTTFSGSEEMKEHKVTSS